MYGVAELDRPDWFKDGNCRGLTHVMFDWETTRRNDRARKLCHECDVQAQCLAYALTTLTVDDFGVWGGLTPDERKQVRKRRQAAHR